MSENGGRLEQVVEHWAPRMQAAGIAYADANRLAREAGEWSRWCVTWSAEAERHVAMGEEAKECGRFLTAGEAYVRAALFFHFAQFMFFDDLDQKWRAAERKTEVYAQAAPLLLPPAKLLGISFEGEELRGYLRKARSGATPLVVLIPGSDSTKEEFVSLEEHFLRRGLATFSFDGPGQGEGRITNHLRPDWGPVLRAVLDLLRGKEELNGRIGIMGMAFGGHLALQGAAAVPEIEALACMNGFYDMGSFWADLPEVYRANMSFALGGKNLEETGERARRYSLQGTAPPTCPTLIVHGGRDRIFPIEDARDIVRHVGASGKMMEFPEGNHVCNNISYKYRPLVADWMAERLGGALIHKSRKDPASAAASPFGPAPK